MEALVLADFLTKVPLPRPPFFPRPAPLQFSIFARIPEENGEGLQILRYELGQKYDAHYDYFFHEGGTADGGNR